MTYEEVHIERLQHPLIDTTLPNESYFSTVRCQTYLGPRSLNPVARLASEVMAELYKRTSSHELDGSFFRPTPDLCKGHVYEMAYSYQVLLPSLPASSLCLCNPGNFILSFRSSQLKS